VSGDITDRDLPEEWKTVHQLLQPISNKMKVILAPGNHDIADIFASKIEGGGQRLEQFVRAQRTLFPRIHDATRRVIDQAVTNAPSKESADYRRATEEIRACASACENSEVNRPSNCLPSSRQNEYDMCKMRESQEKVSRAIVAGVTCPKRCLLLRPDAAKILEHVDGYWLRYAEDGFPLQWIDESEGIAIFSLLFRGVPGRSSFGTNGIGYLDEAQAKRLLDQLRNLPETVNVVVIMHHFPATRGPGDKVPSLFWPEGRFLSKKWLGELKNSPAWLYSFLSSDQGAAGVALREMREMAEMQSDRSFFVLFGHRHARSLSSFGRIVLVLLSHISLTNCY
jgi:3',5'-cyclic AMP phosphodiesterase CpdA